MDAIIKMKNHRREVLKCAVKGKQLRIKKEGCCLCFYLRGRYVGMTWLGDRQGVDDMLSMIANILDKFELIDR